MSLQTWEWEDDDQLSTEPISSINDFFQTASERDVEEYLKAKARAQETDTDHQSSSLKSSNECSSTFNSDVPQVVSCKFIISLAFPANAGNKGKHPTVIEKYRKQPKTEKPTAKVRRFYHIEYYLLPDDEDPKKVDMVLFPAVTKVFSESGVKTVKPWIEDDKIWVSWTQAFSINVTKELLKKINFHKINLKLWDTKDKVSRKARHYRLKAPGHLEDIESFGKSEEVRHLVTNQRRMSEKGISKTSIIKEEWSQEHLPGKQEKEKHFKSFQGSYQTESETSKNSKENEFQWNISRGPNVSLGGITVLEIKELIEKSSLGSLTGMLDRKKSQGKKKDFYMKKKIQKRRQQSQEETDSKLEGHWKQGVFSIQLALMPLLAGWQTVVTRGNEKAASILDCFLTLQTEVPIMNEEQRRELNPLTIKIKCASCLPSQPVPIHELERLCTPVYCRYQFHKTPIHETEGQPHGTHVYFQDINVILLGALCPSDLKEYLEGPPMVVEVHDRDLKSEEYSRKPTLFGEDPLDTCLNLQALISPKQTETNPFESHNKMWNPYGVAQVSFADLLLGHTYLNLFVPIHSCKPKPTNKDHDSRSRKVVGFRVPTDNLQHGSMPMGNYLEANSLLKLRVDLAVPLQCRAEAPDRDLVGTQFALIIFVFDSRKTFLLHHLLQDITMINAKALDLDSYPLRNIQQILSAFKVRVKVQDQQDLDVLTGFHLLDGKIHVFILEGLADQGLRRLWEIHQSRIHISECRKYKVLYNSHLLFHHRLYADLETILYHVHLFKPLSLLMKHPQLYVRNTVPQDTFQALVRLHYICHQSTKLRDVVTRDMLPTSTMIKCLSQEFGMPISQEELSDEKLLALPLHLSPSLEDLRSRKSTLTSEIHAHQEKYTQWRTNMMLKNEVHKNNIIQENIAGAFQVSKKFLKPVVKVIRISAPVKEAVYNYSIQTLNSTELAKKELYQEMAKEPRKRFTYSQEYLSAMLEPYDWEAEQKKAARKSRQAWLTANGFQVPGLQYSHHSRLPPISHAKELKEEWKENALYANILEPVLDRTSWSWAQRHVDFELYKKPPPFFELPSSPALKPKTEWTLELLGYMKEKTCYLPVCPRQRVTTVALEEGSS
ncbi:uncharacterized protein KIAA1257 homolog [Orycteropus afer afer]|uniref:Uncharacterized protein KIAA1257 homolog n=1 Tax=Orycteropus afer afer TaxID=1230840 RepID=A0AC54ZB18_ORYAF|nr:uncharacterized protein KIAA1257 homolog [Orycteropus afer afer]